MICEAEKQESDLSISRGRKDKDKTLTANKENNKAKTHRLYHTCEAGDEKE